MGMISIGGTGSWSLSSKTDPRWNCNGTGHIVASSGYAGGVDAKIEELKKLYGEPPKDLVVSAMKD